MPDLPELRPGDVVDGKYQIVSMLGEGGMGQVFKTRHIHLNTFRTIKVMRRSLLLDEANRNRFVREARLATLVHHQNVAVVHDFSSLGDGTHYMVSEFIEGITIRQWMRLHGRMPVALALRIGLQTLSGLENIHRAGLLHRDLSADNIMISSAADGEPVAKIIDLGVAKQLVGATMSEATQVGLFVGNPRYSSPEQLGSLADTEDLDGRADLYCFGIVLYEMLTGSPPFTSTTPHGYAIKHLTEAPPSFSIHHLDEVLPAGLESAVLRSLEKHRNQRFPSAREFGLALAPFASDVLSPATRLKVASLRGDSNPVVTLKTTEVTCSYTPPPLDGQAADVVAAMKSPNDDELRRTIEAREDTPPPGASEEDDWSSALLADSEEGWTDYLARHPDSVRAAKAERFRDEARHFEAAFRSGGSNALRAFLQTWPESRFRKAVEQRLTTENEDRAAHDYAAALRADTAEAYNNFLNEHPASPYVVEAKRRWTLLSDLSHARSVDTTAVWREMLSRHPDEPRMAVARVRLQELESVQTQKLAAAITSRNGAAARALLQGEVPPACIELATLGLDEVTALQSALRTGSSEAIRRFQRNYAGGHFVAICDLLLSKLEDVAFARVLQSRTREPAAKFLRDFPSSSKTPNVRRLLVTLDETKEFKLAMREIRRGNLQPAHQAMLSIGELPLRNQLATELDRYRKSTGARKARFLLEYVTGMVVEQLRAADGKQPVYEMTPAARELRGAIDEILDELKQLATALKNCIDRVSSPPVTQPALPSPERGLPPRPTPPSQPSRTFALPVPGTPRRNGWAAATLFALVLIAGFVALLFRLMKPTEAEHLIARGRDFARMVSLQPDERRVARLLAPTGQLQIDALPWARVTSVRAGDMEWISDVTWTPARIAVPEGRYQISLTGSDGTSERSVTVDVRGREPQLVRVTFTPVDAAEYLERTLNEKR